MPTLTRRRDLEAADECWHVYYGDVRAGTIAKRIGIPLTEYPWGCFAGSIQAAIRESKPSARPRPSTRRAPTSRKHAGVPVESDRGWLPEVARGAGLHRVEISNLGYAPSAPDADHGGPVDLLLRRRPDDWQRAGSHPLCASGNRLMKCPLWEDCGWVCEAHLDRPWEGEHACGCGGAGAPCPRCNVHIDEAPRMPKGYKTEFDKKGWRH